MNRVEIDIPKPPASEPEYYLIYGEWIQITQPKLVSSLNQIQEPPTHQLRGINEAIDMSPAVFVIAAQGQRPGYVLKWAIPISQGYFEWYNEVQRRMMLAQQSVAQGAGNNH